jgi:hypothetical protein
MDAGVAGMLLKCWADIARKALISAAKKSSSRGLARLAFIN